MKKKNVCCETLVLNTLHLATYNNFLGSNTDQIVLTISS